jgi:uncharacterized protein (DUF2147 family)
MPLKLVFICSLFMLFWGFNSQGQATHVPGKICGKWESTEKNLRIKVYMQDNEFKANVIWFKDTEGKPMEYWTDQHNPDPALRSRKLLGMSILTGLKYYPDKDSWEDGMVYDAKHGHEWNAAAYVDEHGILKVRGYWHFKFIGKTMDFVRIP